MGVSTALGSLQKRVRLEREKKQTLLLLFLLLSSFSVSQCCALQLSLRRLHFFAASASLSLSSLFLSPPCLRLPTLLFYVLTVAAIISLFSFLSLSLFLSLCTPAWSCWHRGMADSSPFKFKEVLKFLWVPGASLREVFFLYLRESWDNCPLWSYEPKNIKYLSIVSPWNQIWCLGVFWCISHYTYFPTNHLFH